MNFFRLLQAYIFLGYKIFWQNRRDTHQLIHVLIDLLKREGASPLSLEQIRRIKFYTLQSCLTNSWFSKMRGCEPTAAERENALCLGAITPIVDDLNDELGLTSSVILKRLKTDQTSEFVSVRYLYSTLLKNSPKDFERAFVEALTMQDHSLSQLGKSKLSVAEIETITYNKGGSWTFLYRMVLCNNLVHGEKEAIYNLGYLMQLTNDVFDVYKDYSKQQTLITDTDDIKPVAKRYKAQVIEVMNQFRMLDHEQGNIEKALIEIGIIAARGLVCFDFLIGSQEVNNNKFLPDKMTRQQLVCDMERPINVLGALKYSLSLMSSRK
jgi:hypothetical protein